MSIAIAVITMIQQSRCKAMATMSLYPFGVRLANAVVSYALYLKRMVWPIGLSYFYVHPADTHTLSISIVTASGLVLVALTALAVKARTKAPYLTFGWFWYLVSLVPVIGIIQVGNQGVADRYTYITLIGPFIAVAWGVPALLERRIRLGASAWAIIAAVVLGLLGTAAHTQAGYWRDDETLCEHAIEVTRDNSFAQRNLAGALLEDKDVNGALEHYKIALRLTPEDAQAHFGLAQTYHHMDRLGEAIREVQGGNQIQAQSVRSTKLPCLDSGDRPQASKSR